MEALHHEEALLILHFDLEPLPTALNITERNQHPALEAYGLFYPRQPAFDACTGQTHRTVSSGAQAARRLATTGP